MAKEDPMRKYESVIEGQMRLFYQSLSEKDRRRYAGIEAAKFGHGGVRYIAGVLGCDANTIRRGELDIAQLPFDEADGRVRKKGGTSVLSC